VVNIIQDGHQTQWKNMMPKRSWNDWIFSKTHTYDLWLQRYKGTDVHKVTLEEHTKYSKEYASWKKGNIEKVN